MRKFKTLTANIEKFDHELRGLSRVEGKTIFIDGALPGETVEACVTRNKSRYTEAFAQTILQASEHRIEAPCPHHSVCGGCRLQHLPNEQQIHEKQAILAEQLQQAGQLTPKRWLTPITGQSFGYRRKARLGVRWLDSKGLLIGFREKYAKRFIANIDSCLVLDPRVGSCLPQLKACISALSIKHAIPQIEVAATDREVALIIRHLEPLSDPDKELLIQLAKQLDYRIYTQAKGLDSIQLLYPSDADPLLDYTLQPYDVNLQFHPSHFTQVNAEVNTLMIQQALTELDLSADDDVLDLFCGIGNFSLPMATQAKSVTGIEYEQQMVDRASQNAARNQRHNCQFFAADLTKSFGGVAWFKRQYDKILLDPPRTGALSIIAQFPQFAARKIVYISCNPATLVRDSVELCRQGYELAACGVMDMFPHTRHVEAIAVFEKPDGQN